MLWVVGWDLEFRLFEWKGGDVCEKLGKWMIVVCRS